MQVNKNRFQKPAQSGRGRGRILACVVLFENPLSARWGCFDSESVSTFSHIPQRSKMRHQISIVFLFCFCAVEIEVGVEPVLQYSTYALHFVLGGRLRTVAIPCT